MIRVLGFALYGPLAASTRYRLGQYVEGLAKLGIELDIRYLLGDDYLSRRFAGQMPSIAGLARSSVMRARDLLTQKQFDLCMIYCELMPLLPGLIESSVLRVPYLYDFDDAFYLKYRSRRFAMGHWLLGGKFERVIRGAAQVTAGSHNLMKFAQQHNPRTQYLPTVVDTVRYVPCSASRSSGVFTIGWIGSPSTAIYLHDLVEPLRALGQESPVRLVVIGGKAPAVQGVEVVELPWSEATEIQHLNSFDVGVMPLPDTEWARGKCAFKLIQYMACGLPVIASPIGANKEVVQEGCGLLPGSHAEWLEALRTLRDQPRLRASMADAGRARVEKHYSLRSNLPILAQTMLRAVGRH